MIALVKKHSGVKARLRLEQYLRRQALTTWAGNVVAALGMQRTARATGIDAQSIRGRARHSVRAVEFAK